MALTKTDLNQIGNTVRNVVVGVVDPYFAAIQKDFNNVYERFDKIEKLLLEEHRRRIEKLEVEVRELRDLLAVK